MDGMVAVVLIVLGSVLGALLVAGGYFAGRIRIRRELDELEKVAQERDGIAPQV